MVEHALVVVEAEQDRADALAVLVHAEPGHDAFARALVLHLQHRARAPGAYGSPSGLATTPSKPAPSKWSNHCSARSRLVVAGVRKSGGFASREQPFEAGAPIAQRLVEHRLVAEREQVERDVRRRDLLRELLHARRGRVLAELERVEVEPVRRRDHELAVEHDLGGQLFEQRLAQLGEVAQQRLLVAALEIEVVAVAEQDAAEAVPLRLERAGRAPTACRGSTSRASARTAVERAAPRPPKLVRRQSRRRSVAQRASWWRLDSWSLRSTDDTWVSTVFTEISRSRATSL